MVTHARAAYSATQAATLRHLDAAGLARGSPWVAGAGDEPPEAEAEARRQSGAEAAAPPPEEKGVATGGFFSARARPPLVQNALRKSFGQAAASRNVNPSPPPRWVQAGTP